MVPLGLNVERGLHLDLHKCRDPDVSCICLQLLYIVTLLLSSQTSAKAGETVLNGVQGKSVSNYKRHTDTIMGEEEFLLHYNAEGGTAFCWEHFALQLI